MLDQSKCTFARHKGELAIERDKMGREEYLDLKCMDIAFRWLHHSAVCCGLLVTTAVGASASMACGEGDDTCSRSDLWHLKIHIVNSGGRTNAPLCLI